MSEKSIGELTVTSVKEKKKTVAVAFSNGEKVSLSPDAYTEFLLYVGKKVDEGEFKEILALAEEDEYYVYALKLLSTEVYTSYVLKQKLIRKGASEKVASHIVKRLLDDGILNDETYVRIYTTDVSDFRLDGKNRTLQKLKEKGVSAEILDKLEFPVEKETERARRLCSILNKRYAKQPYEKKKEKAMENLVSKGYDYDVAKSVVDECIEETPEDIEKEMLSKAFYLAKNKYAKIDDLRERKQKIFASLARKGYDYDDIKALIEEEFHEDF